MTKILTPEKEQKFRIKLAAIDPDKVKARMKKFGKKYGLSKAEVERVACGSPSSTKKIAMQVKTEPFIVMVAYPAAKFNAPDGVFDACAKRCKGSPTGSGCELWGPHAQRDLSYEFPTEEAAKKFVALARCSKTGTKFKTEICTTKA